MKRYVYIVAFLFTFLIAIPTVRANANSAETSGESIRIDLKSPNNTQVPTQPPQNETFNEKNGNSEQKDRVAKPDSKLDSSYPAYCETFSSWVKPEDFEYQEALYKCKHGS